jgi:hypothetical protein
MKHINSETKQKENSKHNNTAILQLQVNMVISWSGRDSPLKEKNMTIEDR